MRDQIENILNEKIRPSLALHSGNVKVISYTGGVLRVRLTGRCSGCPSATLTTEEFIKSEIMIASIAFLFSVPSGLKCTPPFVSGTCFIQTITFTIGFLLYFNRLAEITIRCTSEVPS